MASNTKEQILNAAEMLFAEHGFADTSLRAITQAAKVNLASVNYHFGSKKLLIQAVLQRYLDVLMPEIDHQLTIMLEKNESPTTEQLMTTLVDPLLSLNRVRPNGTATFVQLLGRGYTETQGHLRRFMTVNFGDVLGRFMGIIQDVVPGLSAADLFWRLHFAMGTFVFSMASSQALGEIAAADYQEDFDIKNVIEKLVRYISAGLDAPAN
ncbi:TetR/AcrR family transcriptional regulator [Alteromonadaceae bacterium M269]|nr:TetR/AcrR family transcriptional regulator [Alteromonadaceae bacterium M269]